MSRIAAFGGAYANPYAVRAMLADAKRRGCERIFCLGDLGGFGAEVEALWPLLEEWGVQCIAGNYDVAIGRGDPDCGCGYADERDNHYAQIIYDYTRAHTSPLFAAWMRELPLELRETIDGADVHMVHGSPLEINDFLWESLDDEELRLRLADSEAEVLLCTHTGIPWQRRIDDRLVVNVGAVGRPANDGRRETWYAVIDLAEDAARAELVPVAYDWRAQASSMRAVGLPEPFVETIETGWWTTCLEVVPPRERARGRFHVYRETLQALIPEGEGLTDAPAAPTAADEERPVCELLGTAVFPARLWVYTNFHCNLACAYCVVASSPQASRRSLGLGRFKALVDEALVEGFREIYLTGGEPFLERDIVLMLDYASERLPTVVLTNAMLAASWRRWPAASGWWCRPRWTGRERRLTTPGVGQGPLRGRSMASRGRARLGCHCGWRRPRRRPTETRSSRCGRCWPSWESSVRTSPCGRWWAGGSQPGRAVPSNSARSWSHRR